MNISIILAAGEGTRMKSKLSKVLHPVCGRPILEYVIRASKGAAVERNIIIVGDNGKVIQEYFKDEDVIFKTQPIGEEYPYGTGYAVMQGIDYIEDDSTVIILYGDTPLITEETIEKFMKYHNDNELHATVLTAIVDESKDYGRIVRDEEGDILKIVEEKDASSKEKDIKEINSGIYCFNGKSLKYGLSKIDNNNAQGEYYVTDVIGILKDEGYKVGAYIIDDSEEIHGVNSRLQLAFSEKIMRRRINEFHMNNGVTIIDPDTTYIEEGVVISRDTTIYPGVIIEGDTKIGEDCIIGHNSKIVNSTIDNGVQIETSTIRDSYVGASSTIGPFAQLRPSSKLGENVRIGNFVEVKNSTIGDGTKAGHLSYIGDAKVGQDVNIGCGVVFVNYNGREKFTTVVGDNCFIGSNSNLVAPVNVKSWGYIAAGSTITEEVKNGTLSIARAPQINKEGWVEKKGYKNHK